MAFCLHHSLALSAGVFVNTVDTTPDVLVWKLDRDRGLLEHGKHARLRGHEGQVRKQTKAVISATPRERHFEKRVRRVDVVFLPDAFPRNTTYVAVPMESRWGTRYALRRTYGV